MVSLSLALSPLRLAPCNRRGILSLARITWTQTMTLQESLRALPPDQKLAIVTQLWDDLATSAPLTLPSDEFAEMHRRRNEMVADPAIAIDAEEVWRRVDGD